MKQFEECNATFSARNREVWQFIKEIEAGEPEPSLLLVIDAVKLFTGTKMHYIKTYSQGGNPINSKFHNYDGWRAKPGLLATYYADTPTGLELRPGGKRSSPPFIRAALEGGRIVLANTRELEKVNHEMEGLLSEEPVAVSGIRLERSLQGQHFRSDPVIIGYAEHSVPSEPMQAVYPHMEFSGFRSPGDI